jgi:NAD-dependent deacetylase
MKEKCITAQPNPAHLALAEWERLLRADQQLTVITQNVDGLHQRAGSKNVIELHGSVFQTRCVDGTCSLKPFADKDIYQLDTRACSLCGKGLRPDVVLFDESLPAEAEWKAKRALRDCDLFIAIGTSGTVSPASRFVESAKYVGAETVLVNLEPMTPANQAFDKELIGPAETLVPELQLEFALNEVMLDNGLPRADNSREEMAKEMFDTNVSPDEAAARRGHLELLGGVNSFRYPDKSFDAWIHRYYQVICSPQYLRLCREKYLTPEQIAEIEGDDGL